MTIGTLSRLLFVLILMKGTYSQTYRDQLKTALFTTAAYDADIRPYCGNNDAITVTLDMAMRQLIDLNEPLQIIKANIWIRMNWTDCRLVWDPATYGGIDNIVLPYNKIWVPDITLYDNTGETFFGKEDFLPNIHSDGTVIYNFPSVVDNRCIVDVSHFPYDSQTCKFVFGSWSFHANEVDFKTKNSNGDLSAIESNAEWEITSFPAERHSQIYTCCPDPFVDITFYLNMKRKPKFYIVNIIIPSTLLTVLGVFGFALPCESGEKVSFEITVMLSLAVFQILVADSLPASAETIPYIAIYFTFSLFLVGYATVMSVVVNLLHYRGEEQEIPRIIRRLFFDKLSIITFVKVPRSNKEFEYKSNKDKENEKNDNNNGVIKVTTHRQNGHVPTLPPVERIETATPEVTTVNEKHMSHIEKTLQHIDRQISRSAEWKKLSIIVDRLSCYVYIFVGLIGMIVIFSLLSS